MEKPYILHMITSAKNLSPFDVNMALDAGWVSAMSYVSVTVDEVQALAQDVIFSRTTKGLKRTGFFIGGRETLTAMQMMRAARSAMFPPFEVSVFADPSGAFTTAAAMVAVAEKHLKDSFQSDLSGKNVLVLGGTGPVGQVAAVLAAQSGANVWIIGRQLEKAASVAEMCNREFGQGQTNIQADADANKAQLLETADVVFATGAAGIQLLSEELIAGAPQLKVVADVNAVPPSGVANLQPQHNGVPLVGSPSGALGIGALAIGSVKYQTQAGLLMAMRDRGEGGSKPSFAHYEHAFAKARELVAG